MTVVFSSSSSSLSFTLSSLPDIFFVFFELKSISGLRTRPRSTGNRGQLTLPLLPPSVSRCEVEVGQPAQVNSRTEKGSCCSLWGRSPADLLFNHHTFTCCSPGLVPEQQIFLSGNQFLYLSDTSCSIRNVFFIKVSIEGDSGFN